MPATVQVAQQASEGRPPTVDSSSLNRCGARWLEEQHRGVGGGAWTPQSRPGTDSRQDRRSAGRRRTNRVSNPKNYCGVISSSCDPPTSWVVFAALLQKSIMLLSEFEKRSADLCPSMCWFGNGRCRGRHNPSLSYIVMAPLSAPLHRRQAKRRLRKRRRTGAGPLLSGGDMWTDTCIPFRGRLI